MHKYSEVIGLPVICITDGKKVGLVKDIILDPVSREIEAIVIENRKSDLSKKAILLGDIENIGTDAIIVTKCSQLTDLKHLSGMPFISIKDRVGINGLRVYSKSGEDLGVIKDALFDIKTGLVEGVELSDGLLHDLVQGRNTLPLFGRVEFSDERLLVDKEATSEISNTGGGLRNKLLENNERKETK